MKNKTYPFTPEGTKQARADRQRQLRIRRAIVASLGIIVLATTIIAFPSATVIAFKPF